MPHQVLVVGTARGPSLPAKAVRGRQLGGELPLMTLHTISALPGQDAVVVVTFGSGAEFGSWVRPRSASTSSTIAISKRMETIEP